MSLAQIYSDIEAQGIWLFPCALNGLNAVCIEDNGRYAIFLDAARNTKTCELKEIMAHELGHCATGATHKQASPWDLIQKHEHKANRWAIERYLPYEKLQSAMQNGYTEPWQLAELLDYPESFIKHAIQYYKNNRGLYF